MKNKHIITVGLIALLGLTSCNNFLDKLPDSRLDVDTPEKVAMLLTTAYSYAMPCAVLELMSDNITDNGINYDYRYDMVVEAYMYDNHSTQRSDTPHNVWESCFKAITTSNTALKAIDELEAQGYNLDAHRAEARITRAWSYFLLVNMFCQAYNPVSSSTDLGLPYVTEPISDVFSFFERGTVKEVWDKMNEDIEAALPNIDDDLYSVPKNHFNRKAAHCFAAEFNLFYGNYDKAVEYANYVLGSNPASLLRDMAAMMTSTSSVNARNEYTRYDVPCNLMIQSVGSTWGRIHASTSYNRYALNREVNYAGIFRSPGPWNGKNGELWGTGYLGQVAKTYSGGDRISYYPKLYSYEESSGDGTSYYYLPWVPFTVEKALLTRAEAYVMQERYEEAADDLIMWYKSRHTSEISLDYELIANFYEGYTVIVNEEETYQGAKPGETKFELNPRFSLQEGLQSYMILAVLHARRLEFVHEGWRLLDLKRYGIPFTHKVDRGTDIELAPWDIRLVVQLPDMVLTAGMEPNPSKKK